MKIFFVCINGEPGSGKTTFEHMCQKILGERCIIYSSIDPIKKIARSFGWNGEKSVADRRMLSELKATINNWSAATQEQLYCLKVVVDEVFKYADSLSTPPLFQEDNEEDYLVAFVDIREPEEIMVLKDRLAATTVLINRESSNGMSIYGNSSDDNVYDYNYDVVIWNDSAYEGLSTIAELFFEHLKTTNSYVEYLSNEEGEGNELYN